jgi:hypothetical protein
MNGLGNSDGAHRPLKDDDDSIGYKGGTVHWACLKLRVDPHPSSANVL